MGIPAIWDVLKEQDHSFHLAQLAKDHYSQYGRPLRIAIDEADWRFNNLTVQQVYIIRDKSDQAFQGIEKSMFYRICRLLTLNIQLLFVFDGPGRPWKRGKRGGGQIDYEKLRLLKELLRYMRIPYHEAPGEAEAECARLQRLGVVDAVFSQDSDSLMFGCDFLIRDDRKAKEKGGTDRSKDNTKKNAKLVKVIRGHEIRAAHNFTREGLVLFAMLCGGDYDMKGLPQCGPAIAIRAIKEGLGEGLCLCRTKADCQRWREDLISWLPRKYTGFVPFDYPDIKTLNKYNCPKVSTDEQLLNLRGLRNGWVPPIMETELLELTSTRFNIWGKLYMNWVGPILLTRYLVSRDNDLPRENAHAIKLTKRRVTKADQVEIKPLERKLTFSPFGLTSLTNKDFEGDRMGHWMGAMDQPFEPDHRVEFELPDYLLQKVLPLDILDPPPAERKKAPPRKRKQPADIGDVDLEQSNSAPKRKHKAQPEEQPIYLSQSTSYSTKPPAATIPKPSLAPTRPQQPIPKSYSSGPDYVDLVSDSDQADSDHLEEFDFVPSRTAFAPAPYALSTLPRHSRLSPQLLADPTQFVQKSSVSDVIDLGSPSSESDDENEDLKLATQLSMQEKGPANVCPEPTTNMTPVYSSKSPPQHPRQNYVPRTPGITITNESLGPAQEWSFPVLSTTAVSSPISKGSSMKGRTPGVAKDPIHGNSILAHSRQKDANDPGPSDREKICAARLRHFENRTRNPHVVVEPDVPTVASVVQRESSTPLRPSARPMKPIIECIDLTDD
ncbi:hypothetical protein K504DRAFT_507948 [Pleomassaria siparia CBS 279.74]|uniref:XPG-I domain-containing protein n=1 Tax=Pleomassaria siparia CBS 279.74 TaxID=1314801 RepID=A0A6G1JS51_9PLEO|nr:hypothetical protein K504DRAFT_507948 [Pleomassaria siparia CBS 279.74]